MLLGSSLSMPFVIFTMNSIPAVGGCFTSMLGILSGPRDFSVFNFLSISLIFLKLVSVNSF